MKSLRRVRESLLAKITLFFALAITLLTAAIVSNQNVRVLPIIDGLRQTLATRDDEKLDQLLIQQIASVRATTLDYAYWAEMRDYTLSPNQEWHDNNLNSESNANLGMDFVLIIDAAGKTLYAYEGLDGKPGDTMPDTRLTSVRATLKPQIDDVVNFISREDHAGLALIEGNAAIATIAPIKGTWDEAERSWGAVVMGRYLTGSHLERLRYISGSLFSLDDGNDNEQSVVVAMPDHRLRSRMVMDINQRHVIRINTYTNESIFRQAERMMQWNAIAIVAVSVLLMIALLQSIYTNIIAKIVRLSNSLDAMEAEELGISLPDFRASDELGDLHRDVSELLRRLRQSFEEESSRRAVFATRALLEERVNDRTRVLQEFQHDLRAKQQELLEKEKLASMQVFTGSIVSSLQRPVQRIAANSAALRESVAQLDQWLQELLGENPDPELQTLFREQLAGITDQFDELQQGQERVHRIVDALESVVSLQDREAEEIDVIALIYKLLGQLPEDHLKRTRVQFLHPESMVIEVYPSAFTTCLRHMIDNAWKAIRDLPQQRQPEITVSLGEKEDGITIAVRDNGVGMSPAIAAKAFDAFFTTRVVGDGVGLGLTVARAAMQRHGGSLLLASVPNSGTVATAFLPVRHQS
jgi:two-component system NtrC family sensor kinase